MPRRMIIDIDVQNQNGKMIVRKSWPLLPGKTDWGLARQAQCGKIVRLLRTAFRQSLSTGVVMGVAGTWEGQQRRGPPVVVHHSTGPNRD
jgi:hypothetical protein